MLLNLDLSGADWVTTAYLCGDEAMLDVVRSGRSPHQVTGSRICGVPEETIIAEDKIVRLNRDPEVIAALRRQHFPELATAKFLPRTLSMRSMAKKANHGLNFRELEGMFSLMNELDQREAKSIVQRYTCHCSDGFRLTRPGAPQHTCNCAYPRIRDWWDCSDALIRKTRRLTNCFGRTVYFMGQVSTDLFKQAYAFIPQSTTFDCCRVGMTKMFDDPSSDFRPAQLLAQVHDSLLAQYRSKDFSAMARFAITLGRDYMRPELDYGDYLEHMRATAYASPTPPRGRPYRLNTDLKAGFDWASLHEVKNFMTLTEEQLAEKLQEIYETKHPKRLVA